MKPTIVSAGPPTSLLLLDHVERGVPGGWRSPDDLSLLHGGELSLSSNQLLRVQAAKFRINQRRRRGRWLTQVTQRGPPCSPWCRQGGCNASKNQLQGGNWHQSKVESPSVNLGPCPTGKMERDNLCTNANHWRTCGLEETNSIGLGTREHWDRIHNKFMIGEDISEEQEVQPLPWEKAWRNQQVGQGLPPAWLLVFWRGTWRPAVVSLLTVLLVVPAGTQRARRMGWSWSSGTSGRQSCTGTSRTIPGRNRVNLHWFFQELGEEVHKRQRLALK